MFAKTEESEIRKTIRDYEYLLSVNPQRKDEYETEMQKLEEKLKKLGG